MARKKNLSRRDFLKRAAAGGALVVTGGSIGAFLQACSTPAAAPGAPTAASAGAPAAAAAPTAAGAAAQAGGAAKTIKVGLNVPLSGSAASWGIDMKWVAEEAVRRVNQAGGVTVGGQPYNFQVVTYDNKYTSAGGAEISQKLVNEDKVSYIIGTVGSAPTLAMQAITEPIKMLSFVTAWAPETHDTSKPYSFEQLQEPIGIYRVLIPWLAKKYPQAKNVAFLEPNDATGTASMKVAAAAAQKIGWTVQRQDFYERGTTEFAPIVTKLAAGKPDIISFGAAPPGDVALILKGLKDQGWSGVKVSPTATSASQLIDAAGADMTEGMYTALAPDFSGPQASDLQRELAASCKKATGNTLDAIALSGYDAVQALVKAIKESNSLDSTVLRDTMPKIIFDSSYGPMAFGAQADFGRPSAMLLPVIITQIQSGKAVDVARSWSEELAQRLQAAGLKAPQ